MTTSFPSTVDALNNPGVGDNLATAGVEHDLQHTNANDAIEAIETKVGVNSSVDTASHDYKIAHHTHTGTDGSASLVSAIIQSVAIGTTALRVKRFTGQTADLQTWETEASVVLARITSAGAINGPQANITALTAGSTPLSLIMAASATADALQIKDAAASVLARVRPTGRIRSEGGFGYAADVVDPFGAVSSSAAAHFAAQYSAARPRMGFRAYYDGVTDWLQMIVDAAAATATMQISSGLIKTSVPTSVQVSHAAALTVTDGTTTTLGVDTASDLIKAMSGTKIRGYSDAGITQTFEADGATGRIAATYFNPTGSYSSSSRPASPATGTVIYESDTKLWMYYNGSAWDPMPGQILGYQLIGTNAAASSAAIRDVGSTLTFTMPTIPGSSQRRVRIKLVVPWLLHGTPPTLHDGIIVYLTTSGNTILGQQVGIAHGVGATWQHPGRIAEAYVTNADLTAGSQTVKARMFCATGTWSFITSAYLVAEVV